MKIPFDINSHIAIYGDYTYIDGIRYDDIKMSEVLEGVSEKTETKNYDINKPNLGYKQKNQENDKLTPDNIYTQLQSYFKQNDIIISETGSSMLGISQIKFLPEINIQSQALWGAIGWGGPATLGASLAKEQARVILVTGDGAHIQTALEIGTLLKYNLKPIVIVINNHCFSEEKSFSKGLDERLFDTLEINYSKFARVFEGDIWATKVNTIDDLDKALKVTQIMNKMCYIEICVENFNTSEFIISKEDKTEQKITINAEQKENSEMQNTKPNKIVYETVVHKNLGEE